MNKIYFPQSLYNDFGQIYNFTCQIRFKKDSVSFKKYGDTIVGLLKYSPKERKTLENNRTNNITDENDGIVKFNLFQLNPKIEAIMELKRYGFLASEVLSIEAYIKLKKNQFTETEIRELPKPLIIQVNLKLDEYISLEYGLYYSQIKDHYPLTPREKIRYVALSKLLNKKNEEINNKILAQVDLQSNEFKFQVLSIQSESDTLSEEKEAEYIEIYSERNKLRLESIKRDISRTSYKMTTLVKNHSFLDFIIYSVIEFEEVRLASLNTIPIYLPFNKFVHIFLSHIKELQIGDFYKGKTPFQYNTVDVLKLIEIVIGNISEEIEMHFQKNPNSMFNRKGEMSIEFQGDYYDIIISPHGELNTFYKRFIE